MKKFLIASTAALAMAVGSPTVKADTNVSAGTGSWRPWLKISGEADFISQFFSNDRGDLNGGKGRGQVFGVQNSTLQFDACGKADPAFFGSFDYNLILSLSGNKGKSDNSDIKDIYLKLKNDWLTFAIGNMNGVEDRKRGGSKLWGGVGGGDGDYINAINVPTGVVTTADHATRTKRATKMSIFTPRLWGFLVAVSFTPRTRHFGENKVATKTGSTGSYFREGNSFGQNVWSGIIDFSHELPYGFSINASVSGVIGTAKSGVATNAAAAGVASHERLFHDPCSFAVGGDIGYTYGDHIFHIGGEYVNNQNSYQSHALRFGGAAAEQFLFQGGDAGDVWTIVGSYEIGSYMIAYGYLNSRRDLGKYARTDAGPEIDLGCADADVHSVTLDKKMAPGFGVYAEYTHFRFCSTDNAAALAREIKENGDSPFINTSDLGDGLKENDGHSIIVGAKIKF